MRPANPTTDLRAKPGPAGFRPGPDPAPLPWIVRPRTVNAPSRTRAPPQSGAGPIGGWRVRRTGAEPVAEPGAEPGFAASALPRAMLRAEPARVPMRIPGPQHGRVAIRPALCLCASRSLPAEAAPFTPAEVAAAIGSTHPGALILEPRHDEKGAAAPTSAIGECPGCTALIFGQATPGLPEPGTAELRIATWHGWKQSRVMQTVSLPDFIAPLIWLVNQGLANHQATSGSGLSVGQMVVFDLAPDEIWIATGIWTKLVIGAFGAVEFCLDPAAS